LEEDEPEVKTDMKKPARNADFGELMPSWTNSAVNSLQGQFTRPTSFPAMWTMEQKQ
jgi:hypothetical protein